MADGSERHTPSLGIEASLVARSAFWAELRIAFSLAAADLAVGVGTPTITHASITFLTTSIPYALMPSRKMPIASASRTSGGNTPVSLI